MRNVLMQFVKDENGATAVEYGILVSLIAAVIITAVGDATCRRLISGDFRIKIPLVGGKAERAIVPGLVRRLDVEAAEVTAELAR